MEFKDRIRMLRKQKGLTQEEVATAVGLKKPAIYKYEKGLLVNPKRSLIEKLSVLFGVSPAYLLLGSPQETQPSFEYAYIPEGVSAGSFEYAAPIEVLPRISVPDVLLGHYARNPRIVIMHVNGDSMNRIIDNGSAIAVLTGVQSECIQNGDVIIAYTNEGYTVKRFQNFPKEQCVMLYPDSTNPDFKPIVIPYDAEDGLRIFGKVVQYTVFL